MANMLNSSMLKVFSILGTPFPYINKRDIKTQFLKLTPKVNKFKNTLIQSIPILNESFMK